MAEAGCLRDAKFQNLEVNGNTIMKGINTLQKVKVSTNGDADLTVTEALHAGSVIVQNADVTATRTYTLPSPSEGAIYRLIGHAATSENVKLLTPANTFLDGAVTFLKSGAVAAVTANGTSNRSLTIVTPDAYDITLIGVSSTVFALTGSVTSASTPTVADS